MPLTHVCVWDSEIGYRPVSIEEACELHSNGASASSGYFVCELCAQNVLLTAPGVNKQHFRHDPASPNKECDERQAYFDPTYGRSLRSLNSHVTPLHLVVTDTSYSLQLGFFNSPDSNSRCDRIKIANDSHQIYEYSFERIESFGTTYLNVGSVPSRVYGIEYINANVELSRDWSTKVTGVSATGSFFDGRTGRILLLGGKAYSRNFYYLLQRRPLYIDCHDISAKEVCRTIAPDYTIWYLYKIRIREFSATSAKFFLSYSIFLTEKPTAFYPLWPAYNADPYFIYHNSNKFYFYLSGSSAELKVYPESFNILHTHDGKLYRLYTRDREQLVSLGKSGARGFSYLIKQPHNKNASLPILVIRDATGLELNEDLYSKLPKSKFITVSCQYDGKAIIRRNRKTEHIYKISSDHDLIIDNLSLGTEIIFYHGCDCVRRLRFEHSQTKINTEELDRALVKKLQVCTGPTVPVFHSFGALVTKYGRFPKTKQWICERIKEGEMPRSAYKILSNNIQSII